MGGGPQDSGGCCESNPLLTQNVSSQKAHQLHRPTQCRRREGVLSRPLPGPDSSRARPLRRARRDEQICNTRKARGSEPADSDPKRQHMPDLPCTVYQQDQTCRAANWVNCWAACEKLSIGSRPTAEHNSRTVGAHQCAMVDVYQLVIKYNKWQ